MKTVFKVALGVLIALVIIAIAGVGCTALFVNEVDKELQKEETVTSTSDAPAEEDSSEAPAEDTEEPQDTTFKIGDTVATNSFELTVSNKQVLKPGQYDTAENGILAFDVEFKNLADTKSYINFSEFNLYVDGERMEYATYGTDIGLSGDVNTGRSMKGKLYFDAPAEGTIELIYEPSFLWNSPQITFTE